MNGYILFEIFNDSIYRVYGNIQLKLKGYSILGDFYDKCLEPK